MKEYDVYVPFEPTNGTGSWSWLERLLKEQFGDYALATGEHLGGWQAKGVALQGKLRAYSVCGEEQAARPFFKDLKKQIKNRGLTEVLIVEKAAPAREGKPAGERI